MKHKCILLLSLYSLNRLEEISKLLNHIKYLDVDLSIGEHNRNSTSLQNFINQYSNRIKNINFHPNYGVDIAPFIHQISKINHEDYPYFIKLHSKESKWGGSFHVDWGTALIDTYIGSLFNFDNNLKILKNKHIGMISHSFLKLKDKEGNNSHKINYLCSLLNIDYDKTKKGLFSAGSMFMSKTKIFQKYFNDKIDTLDILLSNEMGKVHDGNSNTGTFYHSLERIFGYLIQNEDLKIHDNICKTIPIFNEQYKKLHLVIMYNNFCYLKEDLNIYGNLVDNQQNNLKIEWLHLEDKPLIEYMIMNNKIMRKK